MIELSARLLCVCLLRWARSSVACVPTTHASLTAWLRRTSVQRSLVWLTHTHAPRCATILVWAAACRLLLGAEIV